jgi:hypothetical protein
MAAVWDDARSPMKAISKLPAPPKFATKLEEREFLKFRLAQAFRIFGHRGLYEGITGHITVRVSSLTEIDRLVSNAVLQDPIKPAFWVNPFVRARKAA